MGSIEDSVRKERGALYGDIKIGHTALGLSWSGILTDHFQAEVPPLPAHIVCLMLAALKIQRSAKPLGYHEDNYVDARNYLDFASETDPRNPALQAKEIEELRTLREQAKKLGFILEQDPDQIPF